MLFESLESVARVVVMALLAYTALIIVLRLAGKRSLAKLNAFDLAVTVAFGSALSSIILTSDIPLADGLAALISLALLQFFVAKASVRSGRFGKIIRSTPRLLVREGRCLTEAMARERITQGELEAAIRNSGIGRIEDVAAVVLETDGSLSVIPAGGEGEFTALRSVAS
jgi:uncharacterized membrane protein YcaP (DUF421 family)